MTPSTEIVCTREAKNSYTHTKKKNQTDENMAKSSAGRIQHFISQQATEIRNIHITHLFRNEENRKIAPQKHMEKCYNAIISKYEITSA